MEQVIIAFIGICIAVGLIVYLIIRFTVPTYFSKKGENLATKEDIGRITQIVEETKREFVNQAELFKSNLQVKSSLSISYSNEQRNAIVDFHDKYSRWYDALISVPTNINLNSIDQIEGERRIIDLLYKELAVTKYKILLFIDDDSFTISMERLLRITLMHVNIRVHSFLNEIENDIKGINTESIGPNDIKGSTFDTSDPKKRHEILMQHYQNLNDNFENVTKQQLEFRSSCRRFLGSGND